MITTYRQWRLRKAHEKYCYWKAKREMLEQQIAADFYFGCFNRPKAVNAAAKEALYMERVEHLIRS